MNRKRRYGKEEFALRGNKIYQESVRPVVEAGNKGRIVAIDIESGAYEIDEDVREEYWREIRRQPGRVHERVA